MAGFPIGLSIAGFDGSGGAGMQADMKVFSALGVYAATVLTSLPIQNTMGVQKVYDLPLESIGEQLDCIFEDLEIKVVKIGMLHKSSIIELVSERLQRYNPDYIVVDPVMVAKSGHRLLEQDAVQSLKDHILPLANVLTPNIPEAEDLLDEKLIYNSLEEYREKIERMATQILAIGAQSFLTGKRKNPRSVVIKGGHNNFSGSEDCFVIEGKPPFWVSSPRIQTKNTHGTGCAFSCAIASWLAKGEGYTSAFLKAKEYITKAIEVSAEVSVGKGKGPVHFFHHIW